MLRIVLILETAQLVWADINNEYALPVEMTAEEQREFLLNKGYIRGMEKMYSVHKTVEDDLRFFWTDGNEKVTISKKQGDVLCMDIDGLKGKMEYSKLIFQ